jgi:hypothetical protein
MTADDSILAVVNALGLPPEARVDARVPKKLLIEQGAPTAADKRAIQEGIDELQWLAACKPATIGVPSFVDDQREYLEIAVVACIFRPVAKATRLVELIHRAIPYPVLLLTLSDDGLTVSAAHKRRAQNEAGRFVIEQALVAGRLSLAGPEPQEDAFLESLALARQPRRDLWTLYEGWFSRIEALNAARLNGRYTASDDADSIARRRAALEASAQLTRQLTELHTKAKREKQLNRRVDFNLQIQRLESDLASQKTNL